MTEGKKLDPIISEFETEEQAASYDRWFRARVQASLDDPGPGIPHDEVMRQMDEVIEAAAKRGADMPKSKKLDPIISEFETEEEAAEYDRWFHAKVQASLDDTSQDIPHDEAMARVKAAIKLAAKKRA
jgi:hypothetical protein